MNIEEYRKIQADKRFDKDKHVKIVPLSSITSERDTQVRANSHNKQNVEKIKTSIEASEMTVPVTVAPDPNPGLQALRVMDGNSRYHALCNMGETHIEVCTFHADVIFSGLPISHRDWFNWQCEMNGGLPKADSTKKDLVSHMMHRISNKHFDEFIGGSFLDCHSQRAKGKWIDSAAESVRCVYGKSWKPKQLREIIETALEAELGEEMRYNKFLLDADKEFFNIAKERVFGGDSVKKIGDSFLATIGEYKGKRCYYYRAPRLSHIEKEIFSHARRVKRKDPDGIFVLGVHDENVVNTDKKTIAKTVENMISKAREGNNDWFLKPGFKFVDVICVYPQDSQSSVYHEKNFQKVVPI